MAAASLAIITSSFAGPERARAIGLWGAMNGLGGATGVIAGGVITELLSWRWVLLFNVPVAVAAAIVAGVVVAERRGHERRSFDLAGALVLTAGLLLTAYGAVTAGTEGWGSADALVPIGVGTLLLGVFFAIERSAKDPLIPPGVLTPQVSAINHIVLFFSASVFSMWFVSSLYLQQVLALSPLETGVAFLPMALAIFACASQAGKLVNLAGVRAVLGGGLLLMTAGLVLLAQIADGGSPIQYIVLPGVLTAMGIGFSIVSSTIAATQTARPEQAGLMSALVNTSRQVGGGLGLAVLVTLATAHTAGLIGDGRPVEESLTDGFQVTYIVGACLAGLSAALTLVLLPRPSERWMKRAGLRVLGAAAVVVAAFMAVGFGLPRSEDDPIGTFTKRGTLSFVSEPGLHPPELRTEIPESEQQPLPGLIMTTNFYDLTKAPIVGQSGPMILDGTLQPVWFKPVPEDVIAGNLEAHTWRGKPVLSWWEGVLTETGETTSGEYVIVDERYRELARIEGRDDWILTLHELEIRGDEAWVTANRNVQADLSDHGGVSNGVLVDSGVQRYDLRTGELLSTWSARDHIDPGESESQPPPNGFPWDAYHINSVDVTGDGRMLLSMRNTWAAYLVDADSGRIEWRLGGKRSDFDLPKEARFEWQHDVQARPGSVVTLFDNHCCEFSGVGEYLEATGPSRALTLQLDRERGTARPLREFSHGVTFNSQFMGSAQELPGGGAFVGWGQVPYLSAFDESGELVFDAALPPPNLTYRAYLQAWTGRPLHGPRCVAEREAGRTTVHASFNGATELVRWRMLAAADGSRPERVGEQRKDGFETSLTVAGQPASLTVQALDGEGRVIGSCEPRERRG
jgi:MFS family permease